MIDKWEEEKYKQVNSRKNSIFRENLKVCWKNFRFSSFFGENEVIQRSFRVIWGHLRECILGGSMMSID